MRWWLCGVLLLTSVGIRAGEVFLIPENNPKPIYPMALHRAGITGMVRISMGPTRFHRRNCRKRSVWR